MTLTLPEHLVIAQAATLRTAWLESLDTLESASLQLDGTPTVKVDATGMALLASLFLELDARKKTVAWTQKPEVIASAAHDLGMARQLHLSSQ
ncbi:MAG: hypothetical protein ABF296_12880 [Oceanococcaceae bacterium]